MNAPFILTRIKLPKVTITETNSASRCYFCNKKIKHEKGYSTFSRQHEEYSDPRNYVCHRTDCGYTLANRIVVYKYKDIQRHASYDYF